MRVSMFLLLLAVCGAAQAATPAMPFQGNTVPTIAAAFPTVIEWAWGHNTAANLNIKMAAIPDVEVARLSHVYWLDTHGNITPLLMLASQKLTAANLVRLRAAFGVDMDAEVVTYAPAAVKSAYLAAVKRVPIKESHAAYVAAAKLSRTVNAMATGVPAPSIWMTPYEIYMEYWWTASYSTLECVYMTAKFMAGPVPKVATWAFTIGTAVYGFGEKIDPDFGLKLIEAWGHDAGYTDPTLRWTDFGDITTVTGTSYIDGPIVEIPIGELISPQNPSN